ncbi:Flp family type IVb pilin [Candidatus Peregrinibacteria bacterium]|jgi:pilus assembly protein Flp/PilA|nr:Flp family type IVb pilin [Candidatus Peregrinibacteria bacterium]
MKLALCKAYLLLKNKKAQAMSEYALILALIAIVAVATITILGTTLQSTYQSIIDSFGS